MCPCQALNTSENPGLSDADLPLHAFPNPFTQFTTIEYENPDLALVHLSVFDLNGREVALLVNGLRGTGNTSCVFWRTKSVAGTILCCLDCWEIPDFAKADFKQMKSTMSSKNWRMR